MREEIDSAQWSACFDEFNRFDRWRPTRLEMFGPLGARQEVERGMPFVGLELEAEAADGPRILVYLGGYDAMDPRHLTYAIPSVKRVMLGQSADGRHEALEIEDRRGEKNLLSFEPLPLVSVICESVTGISY